MALGDLMEKLQVRTGSSDDDAVPEVPDDLSGLEEGEPDALPEDPKPARTGKTAKKLRLSADRPGKATVQQKRQVKDALLLLLTPLTGVAAMKDPHCGGAAFKQREEIAAAMTPIICRNPSMLRWFTAGDAPWLDILALLTALQPVGAAVYQHHWKKQVPQDDEGGPVDYSAYTAG